jgi:hypothetical protein
MHTIIGVVAKMMIQIQFSTLTFIVKIRVKVKVSK